LCETYPISYYCDIKYIPQLLISGGFPTCPKAGFPGRLVFLLTLFALPALSAVTTGGSGSLRVSVDPDGSYAVSAPALAWTFSGNIGYPLMNIVVGSGTDALGTYSEIAFDFQSDAARHATIRSY